jgi:hypothetical protein
MSMNTPKQFGFIHLAAAVAIVSVAIFAASWLVAMFIEMDLFWPTGRGWRVYFAVIVGIIALSVAVNAADRARKGGAA